MTHEEQSGGKGSHFGFLTYTVRHTEKAVALLLLDTVMFLYFQGMVIAILQTEGVLAKNKSIC